MIFNFQQISISKDRSVTSNNKDELVKKAVFGLKDYGIEKCTFYQMKSLKSSKNELKIKKKKKNSIKINIKTNRKLIFQAILNSRLKVT